MVETSTTTIKSPPTHTNLIQSLNTMPNPENKYFSPRTKLFTADSVSMYSHINTDKDMLNMESFFNKNKKELPERYLTTSVLEFLNLIPRKNMHVFGDAYWLQTKGTAMGEIQKCGTQILLWIFTKNTY